MGKGSGRRPTQVDDKTFEDNWSRIFGGDRKSTEGYLPSVGENRDAGSNPASSTKTKPSTKES